jgi:hypothetical protein
MDIADPPVAEFPRGEAGEVWWVGQEYCLTASTNAFA